MEDRKFEIQADSGPIVKVVGDDGEVTQVGGEEQPKENPRYKPSSVFRDMKHLLAYDKQAAKYPKRFKPRVAYAG